MSLIRINRHPSPRDLRVFASLWLVFLGLAGVIAWRGDSAVLATGLWVVAASAGGTGLLFPRAMRPVYIASVYAAFPIGFVVSYLILGIVYFLVITPIGLCLRLARKDPLERRFEPGRKSYWTVRGAPRRPTDYFRQH